MNSANEYRPMTELLAGIVETEEEETQERVGQQQQGEKSMSASVLLPLILHFIDRRPHCPCPLSQALFSTHPTRLHMYKSQVFFLQLPWALRVQSRTEEGREQRRSATEPERVDRERGALVAESTPMKNSHTSLAHSSICFRW
jgi:hypothetical protein